MTVASSADRMGAKKRLELALFRVERELELVLVASPCDDPWDAMCRREGRSIARVAFQQELDAMPAVGGHDDVERLLRSCEIWAATSHSFATRDEALVAEGKTTLSLRMLEALRYELDFGESPRSSADRGLDLRGEELSE